MIRQKPRDSVGPSGQYHLDPYNSGSSQGRALPLGAPPTFLVPFLGAIVGEKARQEGVLSGPWHQCFLFQQPQQAPRLVGACQ